MATRILSTTHSDPSDEGKCNCVVRRAGLASRRSFVRPCALGLVTLGILIFIWGLNYKLSEYQTKVSPSSCGTVVKLWTETRRDAVAPAGHRVLGHRLLSAAHALPSWGHVTAEPGSFLVAPEAQSRKLNPPQHSLSSRGPPASPRLGRSGDSVLL